MHLNPARAAKAGEDADLAPFDRRLEPGSRNPLAVALSGGADSLLALRLTLTWAREHGRAVIALIVDHGLQPQSAEWTAFAARAAQDLGAEARTLAWRGPYPASGLPAAARDARHRLLAEAARAAGARVIVTGHTASDEAENAVLGQGRLEEWSASPAWPEGRGIFMFRPLISLTRGAVRQRLAGDGATWIDDPANSDERHPRVRARLTLRTSSGAVQRQAPPPFALAALATFDAGQINLPRAAFQEAASEARRRVAGAAAVCTGGGSAIPRAARISRLCDVLARSEPVKATLAGASIRASGDQITFTRNGGDMARRGLAPLVIAAGESAIWDGRYAVRAGAAGPLILRQDGTATCPILASGSGDEAHWLVPARFGAACGLIAREGQL